MKRLLILFLGLMLTASLSAQQRIIGLVLTADNEPVVGASVSIEGTTLGTVAQSGTDAPFYYLLLPSNNLRNKNEKEWPEGHSFLLLTQRFIQRLWLRLSL